MIKDLMDGMNASGFYIVKNALKGVTTNGLTYLTILLQDKTGVIEAKKWQVNNDDLLTFKNGNIVYIDGEVIDYKDKLQIKIFDGNIVDPKNADMDSLIPASPFEKEELVSKLKSFLTSIENEKLKKIVYDVLGVYKEKFLTFPAAMSNHHDYLRGLLDHTISMCEIAKMICSHYDTLNYDLLISGCLLHDIGKCEELSGVVGTTYTKEGTLLGHLVIGAMMVDEASKRLKIEGEEVILLKHLILSHHGKLEYGSPVMPLTREALVLSFIDEMDAKMKALDKAFNDVESGEFSAKLFPLDGRMFYKLKREINEK